MSGGSVPYHLRPNKSVDRYLFIELLTKINRFKPIGSYTYVGFGGPFLEDFKLIHTYFDNRDMISLELDLDVLERQLFNLPLSCITCRNQSSSDFISTYSIENSAIVWLDYTKPKEVRLQVQEFEALISKLQTYDIVKVTLNANPEALRERSSRDEEGKLETVEERSEKRLKKLNDRLGDYLPQDVTPEMMATDGLPLVLSRALELAASNGMKGRPGGFFQPLTAFAYSDSQHQMLTLTGMILPKKEVRSFFKETTINKWKLSSTEWGAVHKIKLPELTAREKLFIDRYLPRFNEKRIQKKLKFKFAADEEKSLEILRSYKTYYRQYPNYQRVVF